MFNKYSQNVTNPNMHEIKITIPSKYSEVKNSDSIIPKEEQNALFQLLLNEFFKKVRVTNLFAQEEIAELAFLCEGYFDYKAYEITQKMDFIDDYYEDIYDDEN